MFARPLRPYVRFMSNQQDRERDQLLLKTECAEYLRLSVRSVEKLIQSGHLAAVKWQGCVRVERSELQAFVERHRVDLPRNPTQIQEDSIATGRTPTSRARGDGKREVRLARDVAAERSKPTRKALKR